MDHRVQVSDIHVDARAHEGEAAAVAKTQCLITSHKKKNPFTLKTGQVDGKMTLFLDAFHFVSGLSLI